MKSVTTAQFRAAFAALPEQVQRRARDAYRLFRENPSHPGLQFKRLQTAKPVYSARIGLGYRAVALKDADGSVVWFWIGSHAEYDQLLPKL